MFYYFSLVLDLKVFCITLHFSFGQMIFSILAYGCLPQANFAMKFMQTFCQQYDKIDCKNMKKQREGGRRGRKEAAAESDFRCNVFGTRGSFSLFLHHFILDSSHLLCAFVCVCVCVCACVSDKIVLTRQSTENS